MCWKPGWCPFCSSCFTSEQEYCIELNCQNPISFLILRSQSRWSIYFYMCIPCHNLLKKILWYSQCLCIVFLSIYCLIIFALCWLFQTLNRGQKWKIFSSSDILSTFATFVLLRLHLISYTFIVKWTLHNFWTCK